MNLRDFFQRLLCLACLVVAVLSASAAGPAIEGSEDLLIVARQSIETKFVSLFKQEGDTDANERMAKLLAGAIQAELTRCCDRESRQAFEARIRETLLSSPVQISSSDTEYLKARAAEVACLLVNRVRAEVVLPPTDLEASKRIVSSVGFALDSARDHMIANLPPHTTVEDVETAVNALKDSVARNAPAPDFAAWKVPASPERLNAAIEEFASRYEESRSLMTSRILEAEKRCKDSQQVPVDTCSTLRLEVRLCLDTVLAWLMQELAEPTVDAEREAILAEAVETPTYQKLHDARVQIEEALTTSAIAQFERDFEKSNQERVRELSAGNEPR